MRRISSILFLLLLSIGLFAQSTGFDAAIFSEEDITGSSRYVGLGGAMAALGGDVSAVKDNPAALGVFRRSEVSFSFDVRVNKPMQWSIPAASYVGNFHKNRTHGLIEHSLIISYERLSNFNNSFEFSASGLNSSQTDVMAALSDGYTFEEVRNSAGLAWLAYAGFDGFLTDTLPGQPTKWQSLEGGNVDAHVHVEEMGKLDDYSFGWGCNISNRFYLGFRANVRNLDYSKVASYFESFESGHNYTVNSKMWASGVGIGISAGAIWRPVDMLRVSAAVQSPVVSSVSYSYEGGIVAHTDTTYNQYYFFNDGNVNAERLVMPWRCTFGAAVQFGRSGLLSVEYDGAFRKEVGFRPQHMLKVGAEWAPTNKFFIDFGYAAKLYGKYAYGQSAFMPDYGSPRLDTDQREGGMKHFASCGLSYRSAWGVFGLAYQYSTQHFLVWGHELQQEPMGEYDRTAHKLVFTFGLRYRR